METVRDDGQQEKAPVAVSSQCQSFCGSCALRGSCPLGNFERPEAPEQPDNAQPEEYFVMADQVDNNDVIEIKSRPQAVVGGFRGEKKQADSGPSFEDIWGEIEGGYEGPETRRPTQREVGRDNNVAKVTEVKGPEKTKVNNATKAVEKTPEVRKTEQKKQAKEIAVPKAATVETKTRQTQVREKRIEQKTERRTDERQAKNEEVRHAQAKKVEQRDRRKPEAERTERRWTERRTTELRVPEVSHTAKTESVSETVEVERRIRERLTPEVSATEQPQIFLEELDIRVRDEVPMIFEPVLVINHEVMRIDGDVEIEKIEAEEFLNLPMEEVEAENDDPVAAARAFAAAVYESYGQEITDIEREAHAATVAYESTRGRDLAEPFIERAEGVNNEVLSQVDFEHDRDASDALPPLMISGSGDAEAVEGERLQAATVTTTNGAGLRLMARLRVRLARFLLRDVDVA